MSDDTNPLVTALVATLRRNVGVIARNTEGILQESSLLSVADGSSTLNWLIGHIVVHRDDMLKVLNSETTWDAQRGEKYQRGSAVPVGDEVEQLSALLLGLDRSQELLEAALNGVTEAELDEPAGRRGDSKLEWLEFLTWHDTYHTGQTAVYRRLAGLAGALG